MNFTTIKLGTECRDRATQLKGTITHCLIDVDHRIEYLFQPNGLNPEDGQPLHKKFVVQGRLELPKDCHESVEIPVEILGTKVSDKASGFTGMAIGFTRHINGCFHVLIQPKGTLPKTNEVIAAAEFDLRGCEGKMIKKLTASEQSESEKRNPSPCDLPKREVLL